MLVCGSSLPYYLTWWGFSILNVNYVGRTCLAPIQRKKKKQWAYCSSQFDREQLTLLMHFPVIGECLGWRTTDFEELYGDLGQWSMTKELAREVSGFYLSSPCEVWWIAESVLNMSRSRADGTMKISLMSVSGLHLKTWIMDMWYVGAPITKSFNQFKRNARLVMPHPCEMSAPRKA